MSPLRIGWATPWHAASAIALAARPVALGLVRQGHTVTVLRSERGRALAATPLKSELPVETLAELNDKALRARFDIVVVHLGETAGEAAAIVPRLAARGAFAIFHQPPAKPALAREWIGAVVHDEATLDRVRPACFGPVTWLAPAGAFSALPDRIPTPNRLTVAVVGDAGAHAGIDHLLVALGASQRLRPLCRVLVIGPLEADEERRLRIIARVAGFAGLELTGAVSEDTLPGRLAEADVISALGVPVGDPPAPALLRALSSGRPVLVSGLAPDLAGAALTCRPGHEAVDVVHHLERLVADPQHEAAAGAAGLRLAAATVGNPREYADALIGILRHAIAAQPAVVAKQDLAHTLREFGLPDYDPAYARIATVVDDLIGT